MRRQRLEYRELVRHLRPAEDHQQRALGLAHDPQVIELALQEISRCDAVHVARDSRRGGMRAVRGAECVVDIAVGELGERLGEIGIVGLLAGVEAQVLEQHQSSRRELGDGARGDGTDAVGAERHAGAEQLGEPRRHGPQRVLGLGFALGPAEVRGHEHARTRSQQALERRQRCAHTRVVGDRAVAQRDVEIGAHEYALSPHASGDQRVETGHHGWLEISAAAVRRRRPRARGLRRGSNSPTRCRTTRAASRSCLRSPSWRAHRGSRSADCRGSPPTRAALPCRRGCP